MKKLDTLEITSFIGSEFTRLMDGICFGMFVVVDGLQ